MSFCTHRGVADPVAFTREALARYRRFVPQGGVIADAVAADGALKVRYDGLRDLPGTLGLRLAGLRDDRTAVLALPDGRMRVVPVENGKAYVALGDEESDADLFIGPPIRVSDPRIGAYLSRTADAKGWQVEFHNPTDGEVSFEASTDPRFGAFAFSGSFKLPAGASVSRSDFR